MASELSPRASALRLEVDFLRLLHRCEDFATKNAGVPPAEVPRYSQFVRTLQTQLARLNEVARESPGTLQTVDHFPEYARKLNNLAALVDEKTLILSGFIGAPAAPLRARPGSDRGDVLAVSSAQHRVFERHRNELEGTPRDMPPLDLQSVLEGDEKAETGDEPPRGANGSDAPRTTATPAAPLALKRASGEPDGDTARVVDLAEVRQESPRRRRALGRGGEADGARDLDAELAAERVLQEKLKTEIEKLSAELKRLQGDFRDDLKHDEAQRGEVEDGFDRGLAAVKTENTRLDAYLERTRWTTCGTYFMYIAVVALFWLMFLFMKIVGKPRPA